ncbi:hypothetical protein ACWDNI_34750 [Nocardia niigatensis]
MDSDRRTPDWLRLYRRRLRPEWIDERYDLPLTTAALTVFDCASVLPERDADILIDRHVGRHVPGHALLDLCDSHLHGSSTVRRQLRAAAIHAASEPERLFARALNAAACACSAITRSARIAATSSTSVRALS